MTRLAAEVQRTAVATFAHTLVTAVMNRALHHPDSQHVHDALRGLLQSLADAAAAGVELPLVLQIADDCLFYDGLDLEGPSLQARSLLQHCSERQIAALAFGKDLTLEETQRFFDLLLLDENKEALSRKHRDRALQALGIRNIAVTSRIPGDPADRRAPAPAGDRRALHHYQELADCLQRNHIRASRDLDLTVGEAHGLVERTLAQMDSEPSRLLALATQDNIDSFTVGHSVRVALLALQVARAAGASREDLVQVGTGALLHDIGKSKVPQEILFKQARLNDEEWRWMAQHPRIGAQILVEQPELDRSAIGAAFCHHMRGSGDGYPVPALTFQPSGTSRLVRVCDVFEALTSVRPYKRALTPCEAYAVMFRNERDFDAHWLRFFVHTLGIYPQGTRLVLDDGAEAVVAHQGTRPDQPVVRLLTGAGGAALLPEHPLELSIGTTTAGVRRRIQAVLTHDRAVPTPDVDLDDPQYLTQTPQHACLPPTPNASR